MGPGNLVWVASYPKSGNTMLRLRMMAYENPDEFDPNKRPPAYVGDQQRRFWQPCSETPLEELTEQELFAIRGAALARMARSVAGPVVVKSHAPNVACDQFPLIPAALTRCAIYIVRDPRDVAVSLSDHLGLKAPATVQLMQNPKACIVNEKNIEFITSWSLHVKSWSRGRFPIFRVRYEDLVQDPEKSLIGILNFFKLEPDSARLKAALDLTSFDALRSHEEKHGYIAKSRHQEFMFRRGVVGSHTDELDHDLVRQIEDQHGEQMREMGYLLGREQNPNKPNDVLRFNTVH